MICSILISSFLIRSAGTACPLSGGAPCFQSMCMASMPSRVTYSERSTGVRVGLQDTHDRKRFILVVQNALAAGNAMSDDDPLPELVAEPLCHLAAERDIEHIRRGAALLELDLPVLPVTIMAIKVFVGSDHAITAMAITQRNRNRPETAGDS